VDFDDIVETSFHREDSLLMEEDGNSLFFDFSEIADASFQDGDSLLRDLRLDPLNDGSDGQYGAGR
jgi:hypothetical protein